MIAPPTPTHQSLITTTGLGLAILVIQSSLGDHAASVLGHFI